MAVADSCTDLSPTDPFPRNGEGEWRAPRKGEDGEVVPHDEGPCVAAHRIVQPSTRHLGGAEAIGAQEEFLQLLVRVAEGGGVPGQREDGGDQRKREFRQRPVELHERLRDFGSGEHRVDTVKP